jgi:DNA ligase-associated metallophosphoesterase
MGNQKFIFGAQTLTLLPEKAVLIEDCKTLLLSDLHLGKASHFRKSGIAVPSGVNFSNFEKLAQLLIQYKPVRVIFLGDLFHSHYNQEWESFSHLIEGFPDSEFELVSGNHDILSAVQYQRVKMKIYSQLELFPELLLVHESISGYKGFQLCGHVHPAVKLSGRGRQSLKLPCFWFRSEVGILPAFGEFTGHQIIHPAKTDRVFIIVDQNVIDA